MQSGLLIVGIAVAAADGPAPLQRVAVGVGRDVRLGGLARRVVVVPGLVAARVVRVLVGQAERGVPHLVDGDLGRAAGQRVGADRAAAAAVDRRVDDDEHGGELGHLRGGHLQRGGRVAEQQPADAVAAEGRVEVGAGCRARAAGRGRVVGAGVGRADVDPEDVDRRGQLVERRRAAERGHERCAGGVEVVLLRGGEALGEQDDVERAVARGAAEDLRRCR